MTRNAFHRHPSCPSPTGQYPPPLNPHNALHHSLPHPPHPIPSSLPRQPQLSPPPPRTLLTRPPLHNPLQPKIFPSSLMSFLRRPRYPKRSMLVRHYIVFVFWTRWLVLGWDVDEFVWEVRGAVEFFENVGVAARVQVNVGVGAVFGLDWGGGR